MASTAVLSSQRIETSAQSIYEERRSSLVQCLQAAFDRLISDPGIQTVVATTRQSETVISCVEQLISKYFSSEQEVFIAYLLYHIRQIREKGSPFPTFFESIEAKIRDLDQRYDRDARLRKIIHKFKGDPSALEVTYPVFISKIAGFYCESGTVHSFLFNTKQVIVAFITGYGAVLQEMRVQTARLFVTMKDRLITSKTVAEQQKLLRASQEKRHEDDLTKLNGELLRAQKIIKEKEAHRLNFEGHAIRVVQQVEAMRTDSIEDPTLLLSLVELKKEGQSLRRAVEESPHEIPATPVPESPLKKAAKQDPQVPKSFLEERDETIRRLRAEIASLTQRHLQPPPPSFFEGVTARKSAHSFDDHEELLTEVMQKTDKLRDYYVMLEELEGLRQEVQGLRQQKMQGDEYSDVLNRENIRLKKSLEELSHGVTAHDTLYEQLEKVQSRLISGKRKLQASREENEQLRNESSQKDATIQENEARIKELSVDHGAHRLKGDLLMEEIADLKNQIFAKDTENQEMRKQVISMKQQLELTLHNDSGRQQEYEVLKNQVKKLNIRKQRRDERIGEMQKVIDLSTYKTQEYETNLALQNTKLHEQKERIAKLTAKVTKSNELIRVLKQKVGEQERLIAEMHVMSKGLEKSKKQQDSDLFELKGAAEKLLEASKERDNLDSLLTQSRIEVATLTQKTHVLEERLRAEREKSDQFKAETDALQSHFDQEKML
jgi:hypothetical protein